MFADHPALSFLSQRLPGLALLPETRLADILDSLSFLDFFLYIEESMADAITLDDVAQCTTLGELMALLDSIASPTPQ